ncbi:MAG: alpha-amylase family glycosyl hydrolase [Polyangiaceae bacterium]
MRFVRLLGVLLVGANLSGCALSEETAGDDLGVGGSYPDRDGGAKPEYPECNGALGSGVSGSAASGSGASGNGNCADGGAGANGGSGGNGGSAGEEDAGPPPPPCNEHTFSYTDANATQVLVTGSFSSWAATTAGGALELLDDGVGNFSLTTQALPPGTHQYKFIVDGNWVTDPDNTTQVDDGFGGTNAQITLCTTECGDTAAFDWRDAVMYFAMVDRFNDSDGQSQPVSGVTGGNAATGPSGQYAGGDLKGVTDKLGYLSDLGVTALWVSAPYENRNSAGQAIDPNSDSHTYSAYHGYWPSPDNIDYSNPSAPSPAPKVESRIGTSQDLKTLVDSAHGTTGANGQGMKVLFDYVMNHVDIDSGLYQAHSAWFARKQDNSIALCGPENLWDDPYWGTRCAFTDYLPPFDFDNAAARAWSVSDAMWWAQEYGIDGYRLDAIKHVPLSWLQDLRARLNSDVQSPAGDRFYLVGETFAYDDRDLLKKYVDPNTMLDGQFDFPFKARLCEAVFTNEGSLDGFADWMAGNDGFYGSDAIMTTWIGNHDIPRAIHFASRQIGNCREGSSPGNGWAAQSFMQPTDAAPYERLGVAFAIMLTNPGIPLIYYGDEVGLAGGGDPDNRRMMPWSGLNSHQLALRDDVTALAQLRGSHPVLTRGARTNISKSKDTWVYRRSGCEERDIIVAINRADGAQSVDIPAGSYTDLMQGGNTQGGSVSLPARSFLVLEAQ